MPGDWDSIGELIAHGVALDGRQAALKAITAGVDMDMQSGLYATQLPELVQSGKLKIEVIDQSVTRVLRLKFALGLFERPYTAEKAAALQPPEYVELARQAAEESFVLLKNYAVGGTLRLPASNCECAGYILLPLTADEMALIGPLADDQAGMLERMGDVKAQSTKLVVTATAIARRADWQRAAYLCRRGIGQREESRRRFCR